MNITHFQTEFDKIHTLDHFIDTIHLKRKEAFSKFLDKGLPTKNWEDWRFTNLSAISKGEFNVPETIDELESSLQIEPYKIENVNTIVVYNGHFQKTLSEIPNEVKVLNNLDYINLKSSVIQIEEDSPFDLLNTAFFNGGVSLIIDPGKIIKTAIRILFIANSEESIMTNPRVYLDVGNDSNVTFVEHHVGNAVSHFQNTSILLSLGSNSSLDHIRIQSNSYSTQSIANLHIYQESDSHYNFTQFASGSGLGRTNAYVHLNGEGSNCKLNSLSLSDEKQHLDNHIIIDHKVPHCTSSQLFKSVLREKSSGVFNGRTIVRENAQKTDAKQSNKNLLLSKESLMNSNPQLEIHADDVRCSHGSTTGELDNDALFYLRSRGIDVATAKSILVKGFVAECFAMIKDENIKLFLIDYFDNWLNRKKIYDY
ncbi:MAG: Fe-S cluster assembly protein SufD [Candidatus Marinimicrobia bacterium]|nr:Fe-S cluster assembly protein SufD [Candidatus Neomarinimicrobiota bacterium]|tara:strand:- start:880 stop:2154 length:1275 start_codon:yes stop_codon:yes gene_type:complete